jgi:hypothetical protein
MKKLRLSLEDLQVSSFVAHELITGEGTVYAHATRFFCSLNCETEEYTCGGDYTCGDYTCALSCGDCGTYNCGTDENSCYGSCVFTCQVGC